MKVCVDMFCGAGGESTGLLQATEGLGYKTKLFAINHWERAIETHSANHPEAEHFCEDVATLKPDRIRTNKVALLWASPECTHHSNARGGRPRDAQSRASAWHVLKWLQELYVERVIIENVKELFDWGPLDEDGKPIKELKGEIFRAFIQALRSLGYTVDYRILCAADYGDPTTRKRLFIQAARGKKAIVWPEITHQKPEWCPARDIIDWNFKGQLISQRKKPLAAATLRRIETGIKKYWGEYAEPFLVVLRGTGTAVPISRPLPTVTTSGSHFMLINPFITRFNGGDNRNHSVSEPIPTLDTSNRYGVVEPFITAIGQTSSKDRSLSLASPLTTIVTKQEHCLIEPFLVKFYGSGKNVESVRQPLSTVTTKDRFGLVEGYPDLSFRMLQPHELAAAQGFPGTYKFCGNKGEIVKQIGNAVPVNLARELCKAALTE